MLRARYYKSGVYEDVVDCGPGHTLYIEKREFFTSYMLYMPGGKVLRHDVRNCHPLPSYTPRIIYARTIPWFMWVIYWLRGLPQKWRERRDLKKWGKEYAEKNKEIRAYQKRVLERQFIHKSGRYNR
jgi:hypothetical protein